MSDPARAARAKRLLEKHAPELAALKLGRPDLPADRTPSPQEPERKYPALQALAALRQDVHDEFSKSQLELLEMKARLDADIAVLDAAPSPAAPAAAPVAAAPVAAAPVAAGPAAAAPGPGNAAPIAAPPPPAAEQPQKPVPAQQKKAAALPRRETPAAPPPRPGQELPASAALPSFLKYWPAALLGGALLAAALFFFRPAPGSEGFSLPPSDAAGLCLDADGSRLYFFDPLRQLLIAVSIPARRVESMSSFQAPGLRALAFDGDAFWAADGAGINRYPAGAAYPADGGYRAGPGLLFLSWDQDRLWAVYSDGRLVRHAAGDKLVPEAVFKAPVGARAWLAVSGGRLWTLDAGSGRLSRYSVSANPALEASADVKSGLPRGEIAGFAVGGGAAWVITGEPAVVARLDLARLKLAVDGK